MALEDQSATKSPFSSTFSMEVPKFKQSAPVAQKKNCGNGKLQMLRGEFGENKTIIYKLVFKNAIGKILYDAHLSAKMSKQRKVEEKAYKNQLKVAVVKKEQDKKPTVCYCLINFSRNEDLDEFKKSFDQAIEELQKQAK